jgi:hypothetical protein
VTRPAFFPAGSGRSHPILPDDSRPTIMAWGHNFVSVTHREEIWASGREDDKAKRCNLDDLLMLQAHCTTRLSALEREFI